VINYSEALKNAAKGMVRFKNPNSLMRMIIKFIAKEAHLTHASILVYDHFKQRYSFIDSKGEAKIPVQLIRIDADHPLVLWFLEKKTKWDETKDFLSLKTLKEIIRNLETSKTKREQVQRVKRILDLMKTLKAALCVPSYYHGELLAVFILGVKKSGAEFDADEIHFFQTLASDAAMTIKNTEIHTELLEKNTQLQEKLEEIKKLRKKEHNTYNEIILSLAQEVREKDPSTYGHLEAVVKLGVMTAEELGLDLSGRKQAVLMASLRLHDIGKIGIPDEILKKADKLTAEEYEIMKLHVEKGAKILEPITDFKPVAEIIRCHHEYYNGSGYPRGLKKDEIPLEASIISVVDAFHAMISVRCYKKGFPLEFAINELKDNAGKQFHPQVVDAFLAAFKKHMYRTYKQDIQNTIEHLEKEK